MKNPHVFHLFCDLSVTGVLLEQQIAISKLTGNSLCFFFSILKRHFALCLWVPSNQNVAFLAEVSPRLRGGKVVESRRKRDCLAVAQVFPMLVEEGLEGNEP